MMMMIKKKLKQIPSKTTTSKTTRTNKEENCISRRKVVHTRKRKPFFLLLLLLLVCVVSCNQTNKQQSKQQQQQQQPWRANKTTTQYTNRSKPETNGSRRIFIVCVCVCEHAALWLSTQRKNNTNVLHALTVWFLFIVVFFGFDVHELNLSLSWKMLIYGHFSLVFIFG